MRKIALLKIQVKKEPDRSRDRCHWSLEKYSMSDPESPSWHRATSEQKHKIGQSDNMRWNNRMNKKESIEWKSEACGSIRKWINRQAGFALSPNVPKAPLSPIHSSVVVEYSSDLHARQVKDLCLVGASEIAWISYFWMNYMRNMTGSCFET